MLQHVVGEAGLTTALYEAGYTLVESDPDYVVLGETRTYSLVVSGEAEASWWLLDPGDVDDRGEWRAGRWSSWNPGMEWLARDFFGLFQHEVSMSERLLAKEQCPPPPPGTGRSRNEQTVGDINGPVIDRDSWARNGYTYVRAEGFASVVTISAPPTARLLERLKYRPVLAASGQEPGL